METSRRSVIKLAAASGLAFALSEGRARAVAARRLGSGFQPIPCFQLHADGRATLFLGLSEMGQGVTTMAAMLVAEELDLPLDRITVEQAQADPERFGIGGRQATGGSTSARLAWEPLRQVGATARAMLLDAAARQLEVPRKQLETTGGVVRHPPTGRQAHYGDLVQVASLMVVPQSVSLKTPTGYRIIGRDAHRVDGAAIANGSIRYGIDVKVPHMKVAAIVTCPEVGGRLLALDEAAALQLPGVVAVVMLDDAFAVVAEQSWTALSAARSVKAQWSKGVAVQSQADVVQGLEAALQAPGAMAFSSGDAQAVLAADDQRISATYSQSFLAHAPIEPLNCTAHITADRCEIWTGTQVPGPAREAVAQKLGLPLEQVVLHNFPIGGTFGRRLDNDFVLRAVDVARRVPWPVKLLWSREEDFRQDFFRPAYLDRLTASLDGSNKPVGWSHQIAGSSVFARVDARMFKDGVDLGAIQSAIDMPYALPIRDLSYHRAECGVRTGSWRGVGRARTLFPLESFVDELAHAAGIDPIDYRRALIDQPRLRHVLDVAAERAGWNEALPAGEGRGVSVLWGFGSFVAQIVHVAMLPETPLRIRRIVAVIDCGRPINPDGIRAQMEGGILFGLSAALGEAARVEKGRMAATSFANYRLLRINAAPPVEVHIVASEEEPRGVGESGVPGIAPALANAIFAASGRRIRALPLSGSGL
ncbi:MAG: molybdopterin-dependent oxidoreductase [Alphaproteobacteria bacterium]|nr:molybdopterin-dependent oxidoreductase [Alphaproteobacteria bacterium]MBU0832091.1 molybdopterin-dependent oxidoreductase [Alphaproteobacteria bacterium]MBU1769907.1 molybdopterin-dependent oxidoreductase [Alphaproteobacteria bacterium]